MRQTLHGQQGNSACRRDTIHINVLLCTTVATALSLLLLSRVSIPVLQILFAATIYVSMCFICVQWQHVYGDRTAGHLIVLVLLVADEDMILCLDPPSTTPFFVADADTRRLWCYKAGHGYVHDKHDLQMTMKHQTIEGTIAMERNHLRVTSCDRTSSKVQPHSQQRQRNFRNPRRQTRGKGWHVPWLNRVDAMHDM